MSSNFELQEKTLERIQDTAVKAAGAANKVVVLDLPKEPDKYAIVKPDGSLDIRDVAFPPRTHTLGRLDQVSEFVKDATERLSCKPVIWYSPEKIVVILDDVAGHRKNRAELVLKPTREVLTLEALAKGVDQKKLIRALRVPLFDALGDDGIALVKVLRVLDFNETRTGHGTIEHKRESMGRDIESEIRSAAGDIPESIVFKLRLIEDPALTRRFQVICALDVEVQEREFFVAPLGNQLSDAMDQQLKHIHELLEKDCDCPIFYGRP